ncbi:hypothetical protein PIB30_104120 [Stylosanthes scabra]|uniref:Uncharacterized protein n=1 Tax=Stylosanthes scabra TaxID=79078 RepID=A0ABU6ZWU8_9FABA|nr:hypothetical protein [Stylosanthes scabra]
MLMGIWGMAGVGKTTIAKAVYNHVRHNFDSALFLPNIREMWKNNKQIFLQEQVLNRICKAGINIQNIASGVAELKQRLPQKRVFIVLDDVDKIDQLEALCGSRGWFGAGSRIIITARDRRLLRMKEVDHDYQVEQMNNHESLELFSWNAFNHPTPSVQFSRLALETVKNCEGMPSAIVTVGRELFGKTKLVEWENVIEELKAFSRQQGYEALKISYDSLNEDRKKEIFLNIASFCIGMEREEVLQTLREAFDIPLENISFLGQRGLITFDQQGRVQMHHLLQEMAREILRELSQTQAQSTPQLAKREIKPVSMRSKNPTPFPTEN